MPVGPLDRRTLLKAALCGVGLLACQSQRHPRPGPVADLPPGTYADGPEGLKKLWTDILLACQKDERGRVHDLMASLAMTQAELGGLIGPERATALWPRYQQIMGTLANIGAMELVAQVLEKKYDDVAVVRVDTLPAAELQDNDRRVREVLAGTPVGRQTALYTARIKHKDEAKGLRYEFLVYLDGRWRTGNLLGQYLR